MTSPSHLARPSRRQLITGAVLASAAAPAHAAPGGNGKGQDIGFRRDAIQDALEAMVDDGAVGVVASVVGASGGFQTAAGLRQIGRDSAKPQDRVRVASVTKGMVATMVMQEIEAGRWSLDTTIDDVVPDLYPGHGHVTVAQLMNHTSGMPDGIYTLLGVGDAQEAVTSQQLKAAIAKHYPERELVRTARELDWLFEPGEAMAYSNTGYVMLSIMLEEVSGTRIEDLLRDRVLRPAGMHHSRLEESTIVRGRHLMPYGRFQEGLVALETIDPSIFSGAGGVYATAEDLTSFSGALLRGELVNPELVEQMITPQGAAAQFGMGFGLYVAMSPCLDAAGQPERLIGHDGAGFGTQTLSFSRWTPPAGWRWPGPAARGFRAARPLTPMPLCWPRSPRPARVRRCPALRPAGPPARPRQGRARPCSCELGCGRRSASGTTTAPVADLLRVAHTPSHG